MKVSDLISIAKNPVTNDYILVILIACLLIVCISKYLFAKNFNTLTNKTEYLSFTDDNTMVFSFFINFVIVLLVSTMLVAHYDIQSTHFSMLLPARIGICFVIISVIMSIKLLIEMAYFKVFYQNASIAFFLKSSSYVHARSALILLISSFLYFYSDIEGNIIMLIWFILLCINRIWEMYFRYSTQITANKSIWYYNILYLCTLEILPILVLAKLLILGKVI